MCVEHFLDPPQVRALQRELVRCRLFQRHDEAQRRAVLQTAGLDGLTAINRVGDTLDYFERLYPALTTTFVPVGPRQRLALALLLDYLLEVEVTQLPDPDAAEAVFQATLQVYEAWEASGRPRRAAEVGIAAALQRRRAERQAVQRRSIRRYKLDSDAVLLSFDLDAQINHFGANLASAGLFAFALSGAYELIRSYVIARLRGFLEWRTARQVLPLEVPLNTADLASLGQGSQVVRQRIATLHGCARLADLVHDQPIDTLLIVWNHDIPRDQLKPIARAFLEEATRELQPLIRDRSRLFVVLWVSLAGEPLDDLLVVPPVQFPDSDAIVAWFRDRLTQAQVDPADVADALARLRRSLLVHAGYPPGVYSAMKEIIEDLQRGRRAS